MSNETKIKTEFHLHTAETSPCAHATADEAIAACAKNGYGAVIVTDHYLPGAFESPQRRKQFLLGYRQAKKAGKLFDMVVLPGMEFRFSGGMEDLLIYGMKEEDFEYLPNDLCSYSMHSFSNFCHANGYLLFQAHPFRAGLQVKPPQMLDGVEIINCNPRHNNHNDMAISFARKHNLLHVIGGDIHEVDDVQKVGMMVPKSMLTPKGIVRFLGTQAESCCPFPLL